VSVSKFSVRCIIVMAVLYAETTVCQEENFSSGIRKGRPRNIRPRLVGASLGTAPPPHYSHHLIELLWGDLSSRQGPEQQRQCPNTLLLGSRVSGDLSARGRPIPRRSQIDVPRVRKTAARSRIGQFVAPRPAVSYPRFRENDPSSEFVWLRSKIPRVAYRERQGAIVGGLAYKEGITSGRRVVAVNDGAFTPHLLRGALKAAKNNSQPIRLLALNDDCGGASRQCYLLSPGMTGNLPWWHLR
jgi:hypothetical protein